MSADPDRPSRLVVKHVHDVRNSINGLDMEAVMLAEKSTDPQVIQTMGRIRLELKHLEATVKSLLFKFADPQPMAFPSRDLLQLWQHQIAPLENATHRIEWSMTGDSSVMTIDANAILSVLRGLVLTAWSHHPRPVIKAGIINTPGAVIVELREAVPRIALPAGAMAEEQLLVERNGGSLTVTTDGAAHEQVTCLSFPVTNPSRR